MRKRNSAFEIMRIFGMFLITFEHAIMNFNQELYPPLSSVDNVARVVLAFAAPAVNIFFLLTGYFAESRKARYESVARIWIKLILYSGVVYLIVTFLHGKSVIYKDLFMYLTPVFSKRYWFMTVYIVLALLMPYIARLAESLNQSSFLVMLAILLIFFCIHPTFIPVARTLDGTGGCGIIWAITLAFIGCYIRKYSIPYVSKLTVRVLILAYILISLMIFISNILIIRWGIAQGVTSRGNFYVNNSVTVLIQSVVLFSLFLRLAEKNLVSKGINYIAKHVLSVYLIAGHPLLIYNIWNEVFHTQQFLPILGDYLLVTACAVIVIMVVCILIDSLADLLLNKTIFKLTTLKIK